MIIPSIVSDKSEIRPLYDYIFITAEKAVEDTVDVGGMKLFLDGSFDPLKNARTYGKVVAIPEKLSDAFIGLKPEVKPLSEVAPREFRKMSDITPVIEVGDEVYFHYGVLGEESSELMVAILNGDPVYRVRYDRVWARKDKEGNIEGVGSNVLVEPIMESWEEIMLKTYTNLQDKEGNLIPKPKDQWIYMKAAPENNKIEGIVKYSGYNYKDYDPLEVGRKVMFVKNGDFMIKIGDEQLFALKSHNVYCYVD